MSFLNETKLMNVRYTQSTEELKLMKIAVYIQQRFRQNATTEDVILSANPIRLEKTPIRKKSFKASESITPNRKSSIKASPMRA